MLSLSYKKLTLVLTTISILLVLWLSGAFILIVVKGDTIYQPDKGQAKEYKTPTQTEMVKNKFGENIEILTAQSQVASSEVFLYLHGNVGRIPRLIEEMSQFGLVVSPSYPGFGNSDGKPSTERLYDTVDTTMRWLVEKGITPNQVTVIGHSMGGAPAVYAGAEYPDLKKVILVSTFYSIQAMCEKDYYILCALSGGVLNSAAIAPEMTVKTRVFNSKNDKTVPYQQGKDLYNLIGSKDKKFTDLKDTNPDDYHSGFSVAEILAE
jgi:pimeloyl-ACP methyl ester carboxylesterase